MSGIRTGSNVRSWRIVLKKAELTAEPLSSVLCLTWEAHVETRVHSAEQATEMALAAYGESAAGLSVRVETHQDLWIVRIGPDAAGHVHSYLITEWDERAEPLIAEVVDRAEMKPLRP